MILYVLGPMMQPAPLESPAASRDDLGVRRFCPLTQDMYMFVTNLSPPLSLSLSLSLFPSVS